MVEATFELTAGQFSGVRHPVVTPVDLSGIRSIGMMNARLTRRSDVVAADPTGTGLADASRAWVDPDGAAIGGRQLDLQRVACR